MTSSSAKSALVELASSSSASPSSNAAARRVETTPLATASPSALLSKSAQRLEAGVGHTRDLRQAALAPGQRHGSLPGHAPRAHFATTLPRAHFAPACSCFCGCFVAVLSYIRSCRQNSPGLVLRRLGPVAALSHPRFGLQQASACRRQAFNKDHDSPTECHDREAALGALARRPLLPRRPHAHLLCTSRQHRTRSHTMVCPEANSAAAAWVDITFPSKGDGAGSCGDCFPRRVRELHRVELLIRIRVAQS